MLDLVIMSYVRDILVIAVITWYLLGSYHSLLLPAAAICRVKRSPVDDLFAPLMFLDTVVKLSSGVVSLSYISDAPYGNKTGVLILLRGCHGTGYHIYIGGSKSGVH